MTESEVSEVLAYFCITFKIQHKSSIKILKVMLKNHILTN